MDLDRLSSEYWDQNEFLFVPQFLSRSVVEEHLVPQAQGVKSELNRNYIPATKRGERELLYWMEKARVSRSVSIGAFLEFLSRLVRASSAMPRERPHSCALYYYTEPGDHIGFHYERPTTRARYTF